MKPCPNPKCDHGEVPGGEKGWLLCPDCKGAGMVPEPRIAPGPRSYPDAIENPRDPPTVGGTDVTVQT